MITDERMIDALKTVRQKKSGGVMETNKPILDACCGSKMFQFDKQNPNVEFCDNRQVPYHEYYPHNYLQVKPDVVCDFRKLPFASSRFYLVVFDPPHLTYAGPKSWTRLKYGCLDETWPDMIHDGFWECMRVLKPHGTLIFKWSEVQIPLKDVLKAIGAKPLFGHRSGKNMNTHWMAFMKFEGEGAGNE